MAKKARILIVDDNLAVVDSLHKYFNLKNWLCDKATSGSKAISLARSNHYRICIVDIGLEDMDGVTTIQKIHQVSPDTLFLIYTGILEFEFPDNLRQIGMSEENLMLKPLQMSLLEKKISELIDQKP